MILELVVIPELERMAAAAGFLKCDCTDDSNYSK